MNKTRYDQFTQAIARFILFPADGIEIGGVTSQLVDIIRTQTAQNKSIRKEVHEWIECFIELGYARDIHIENPMNAYDNLFYK